MSHIIPCDSAVFPTTVGPVVSETILRGYSAYPGTLAHYILDNSADGLKNRSADGLNGRPAPGTYDLTVVGATPSRTATHAVVSLLASYDTGVAPAVPMTVLAFFASRHPNGQYVCGNGDPANFFSLRTEVVSNVERLRYIGFNGVTYLAALSGDFPDPWRCMATAVSATSRTDYAPQKDEDAGGLNYSTQSPGPFSITSTPTIRIGGNGVAPGSLTGVVPVAEVMIFNNQKTPTELDEIYEGVLWRSYLRGIAIPPV